MSDVVLDAEIAADAAPEPSSEPLGEMRPSGAPEPGIDHGGTSFGGHESQADELGALDAMFADVGVPERDRAEAARFAQQAFERLADAGWDEYEAADAAFQFAADLAVDLGGTRQAFAAAAEEQRILDAGTARLEDTVERFQAQVGRRVDRNAVEAEAERIVAGRTAQETADLGGEARSVLHALHAATTQASGRVEPGARGVLNRHLAVNAQLRQMAAPPAGPVRDGNGRFAKARTPRELFASTFPLSGGSR